MQHPGQNAIQYVTEREPDPNGPGFVLLFAVMEGGKRVQVEHVIYHSPTGLEYGYGGSGPADMALTILGDWFGCDAHRLAAKIRAGSELDESERRAVHWHQDFKWKFVANAHQANPLAIGKGEIVNFVADQIRTERGIDAGQG